MNEHDLTAYALSRRKYKRAKDNYEEFLATYGTPRSQRFDEEPGGGTMKSPDTLSAQMDKKTALEKAYNDAFSDCMKARWNIEYVIEHAGLSEDEKDFVSTRYLCDVRDYNAICSALHRSRSRIFQYRESVLKKISTM